LDIHYDTCYGQAVYVIGKERELGSWSFAATKRLSWTEV